MFATILSAAQQTVLERIAELPDVRSFYLAGGTALALQLGHRRSADFDFFRQEGFNPTELLRRFDVKTGASVRRAETDTLTIEFDGVMLSFFGYPYPLLHPLQPSPWSIALAASQDIAAMKLSAIAGRGSRKDFVDLYFVCREVMPLENVLGLFEKKFGGVPYERYHILKSLTYFDDADSELMPDLVRPVSWPEIKAFFRVEATKCFRSA